ncbi:MAG TPA: hypothetical protein VFD70_20395 [Anaerolineae bacterium]|nr:hypothetical protein [Anaerolineae bacterium]
MPMTEPVTHPVTRGASEIDLELFTFVERYATNLFRWDLILFFGKNPDAEWTSGEIAEKLHRGAFPTTKELDDLTYLRVLVRRYTPNRTTYRLTKRANVRRAAMRLATFETPPAYPSVS